MVQAIEYDFSMSFYPDIFVWALDEVAAFQGDPSIWVNDWTSHMFFEMYGMR